MVIENSQVQTVRGTENTLETGNQVVKVKWVTSVVGVAWVEEVVDLVAFLRISLEAVFSMILVVVAEEKVQ